MMQILKRAKFIFEPHERVGRKRPQRLDRDARSALAIERLVDNAHPALTQASNDVETLRSGNCGHQTPVSKIAVSPTRVNGGERSRAQPSPPSAPDFAPSATRTMRRRLGPSRALRRRR